MRGAMYFIPAAGCESTALHCTRAGSQCACMPQPPLAKGCRCGFMSVVDVLGPTACFHVDVVPQQVPPARMSTERDSISTTQSDTGRRLPRLADGYLAGQQPAAWAKRGAAAESQHISSNASITIRSALSCWLQWVLVVILVPEPANGEPVGCAPLVLPDRPSNPFPSSYAIDTISPLATTSQKRAALPPPHHPYRPLTSSQVSRYSTRAARCVGQSPAAASKHVPYHSRAFPAVAIGPERSCSR